jgi:hypothetical protein
MRIHKIEAAERQLNAAISTFFSGGDSCAVIALAAAAEEVVSNYVDGKWVRNNQDNMFCRMYNEAIRRGFEFKNRAEFSKRVNATRNSLKHSDREEEQYVSVDQEEMVIRLMLAVMTFQIGAGRPFSELMTKFELWLKESRPHYLEPMK